MVALKTGNTLLRSFQSLSMTFVVLVILTTCFLLLAPSAHAATLYWQAANGLSNNPTNWSTTDPGSCSGGTPSDSAPGSGDTIVFDADCDGTMVQIGALDVTGVTFQSGFSGTFTQGNSITIGSGGWDQQGGTFTGDSSGSTYNISINSGGDFSVTGGTFISTNDTLSTTDNFTINGGTFAANNGNVTFDSSDNTVTITGSPTFNNVTFPTGCIATITYTVASGSTITVEGTLSVGAGCGGTGIYGPGGINLTGNLDLDASGFCNNSGDDANVVLTVNGTGSQSITGQTDGDYPCLPGLIIDKPSGTLTLSNSMEVVGDFTYISGTVSASTSDILFNGEGSASYTISGTVTLGTVRFSWNGCANSFTYTIASGTTLTASEDLYGEGGCGVPTVNGPGTLIVQGDINTANNGIVGNIPLTLSGSSAQTITHNGGNFPTGTLTINKSSGTVTLGASLNLSEAGQDLLLTKGTLDLATFTLTVNDTITVNGGATLMTTATGDLVVGSGGINNNGGEVNLGTPSTCGAADGITITSTSGGSARTWSGNGSYDFYDVAITDMTDQKGAIVAWSSTNNGNTNVRILSGCPTPPTAYWKFDDGQGTTAQDSENNWDGTLTNSPTWKIEDQCVSGKCISFDGTDDFVDAGNISSLGGVSAMTISMWFKLPDLGTNRTLIAKADYQTQNSWAIQTDNSDDDELRMFVFSNISSDPGDNNIYTTNADLTVNTWYHLVVVYDGTQGTNGNRIKFYLDGRQLSTGTNGTIPTSLTSATSSVKIGKFGGTLDRYFKGIIDEPKIYNYALTSAQIKKDFNLNSAAVLGINTKNMHALLSEKLAGYWPMDEVSGDSVADQTGNGRTGTATNGPTIGAGKFGNSRVFDGTDDFINVSYNAGLSTTAQVTISAWVKTTDSDRADILTNFLGASPFSGYGLVINPGFGSCTTAGTVGLWVGDESGGYICTTTTVHDGNWHHIVGTFDGTTGKIYIDGTLSTSAVRTNGIFHDDAGTSLRIGADAGPSTFLDGQIDDVRVYTRTFSAGEVTQLYNWAPGPKVYLKFDDKSGQELIDSSGNGYTSVLGTNSGSASDDPSWAQGKYGGALSFDGTDDFVSFPNSNTYMENLLASNGNGTIEVWVKPTGSPETGSSRQELPTAIVGGWGDIGISRGIVDGEDRIWVFFWTTGSCTEHSIGATYTINEWAHISLVSNNGTMSMYKNGSLVGSTSVGSGTVCTNNHNTRIGVSDFTDNYWTGGIDDVRIFDYPRTTAQIISDINAGHPAPGSPVGTPIGHWKLDEGFGDTTNNNGNGGAAFNGNLSGSCPGDSTCPTWTNNGKFGKALNFVGANSQTVDAGDINALDGTSEFTMSAWIKKTDLGQFVEIGKYTDDNNRIGIEIWGDGNAYFHVANGGAAYGYVPLNDTDWHHYVISYNGALSGNAERLKVFIDGKQQTLTFDGTIPATTANHSANFFIGSYTGFYSTGIIDEVKVYAQSLTADQIKVDMNRGASQVLGSVSASSDAQSNSAANEYCPPDSSTAVCTGPVGEWKLDEGSGTTTNDSSGNANTGTINGSTFVNGKINKALSFNGSSNYVDLGTNSSIRITGNLTLEAWIKLNGDYSSTQTIISNTASSGDEGNYLLEFGRTDNKLTFVQDNAVNATSTNSISDDKWHHITYTRSGSSGNWTHSFYIDGILDSSTNDSENAGSSPENATIGRAGSFNGNYFKGFIDQVRIYNYARSAAQVAWSYNKGGPVGWWKMDECQGTTIRDASGNNLVGTLTVAGTGSQTAAGTCSTSSTAWGNGAVGKRNSSISFDGTDDYITLGSINSRIGTGDAAFSIAAWVNPSAINRVDSCAFSYGDASSGQVISLCMDASGNFYSVHYSNDHSFTTDWASGVWQHAVITYDPATSTERLYVNGNYMESWIPSDLDIQSSATSYIGRASWNGVYITESLVDDVRLYNYPLSATQVKQLYNDGSIRFGPETGAP